MAFSGFFQDIGCELDDKITQTVSQMMGGIELPQQPQSISPLESLFGSSGHMSGIVSPTNSGGNGNDGNQSNKKRQSIDSASSTTDTDGNGEEPPYKKIRSIGESNRSEGNSSNGRRESSGSVPRTTPDRRRSEGNSSNGRQYSTGYSTSSIVEVYSPRTRQILSVFTNTKISDQTVKQFLDYFNNYNRYKRDERLAERDERLAERDECLAKLQHEKEMLELLAKHGNKRSVKNFMQNRYNRK